MTEPKPQWPATEAEVLREVDKRLRAAGWFVVVTSQDKSTRRQLAGLPDRIAFRNGVTLLIEGKSPRGQLRRAQRAFAEAVRPHLGPHLYYEVVRHPAQIEPYCKEDKMKCPECNATMEWVRTGTHVIAGETVAEEGFWRCPSCGATC